MLGRNLYILYNVRFIGQFFPLTFEFEYFPAYSLELNPVESCWNKVREQVY